MTDKPASARLSRWQSLTLRYLRARARLWRQRGKQWSTAALQLYLRFAPAESQRVFILTLIIGVLCGLAAVMFHVAIRMSEVYLINSAISAPGYIWIPLTILTPTMGGLVAGFFLQYVMPEARGSGIPQVKVAYAVKGGRIPFRVVIGKFFIATLQIGSGASLGREGPTVQICAGIASALGQAAALSRQQLRRILPVGAAAGIAAAFNAPIAAVTFTIEEIIGDLDNTMLSGVVIAAAIAAVIERRVLGGHPVFNVPESYGLHHVSSLGLYALLGVLAAVTSLFFTDSLLSLRARFARMKLLPAWMRPAVGGLITGILAVSVLLIMTSIGQTGRHFTVAGTGFEALGAALHGELALRAMLALGVAKLVATAFSYGSGGAGGIFAPSLFIGGMLGGSIGYLDMHLLNHDAGAIGAFALVGMGAVFAGVIRAPITSVLIIFEMTGGYDLILPLMIANTISYGLARHWRPLPIYHALLAQDNIHLPRVNRATAHVLDQVKVQDAMTSPVVALPAHLTVEEALSCAEIFEHSALPIVDDDGNFLGFCNQARLRREMAAERGDKTLRQMIDSTSKIFVDQPLLRAVVRMNKARTQELAVVSRTEGNRLLGVLTMGDIMRAQALAIGSDTAGSEPDETEVLRS